MSLGKTPCGPDETLCPGGCCTLADAYCCPDLKHCAPSPDKCPQSKSESVKKKLLSVGKYNCNGTDEIQCPGGCCHGGPNWPNWPNWHCCRYGAFCAPYAEDCIIAKNLKSVKKKLLSVGKSCGPDETECPGGCCTSLGWYYWYCCPKGIAYCAATAEDCIFDKNLKSVIKKLLSVGKSNCDGPDTTQCPGGCCHEGPDWHCCPDGRYCAAEAEDC